MNKIFELSDVMDNDEELYDEDDEYFDEEDEAIGAAQSVRGYHTLEYLLFKDGQPRTVDGAK